MPPSSRTPAGSAPSPPPEQQPTPPPLSLDQSFTLPTIMTMQSQLGGIVKQLEHIEKKMDEVSHDVKKHGQWIFAANALLFVILATMTFLAPRIWDLLIKTPPAP